MKLKLGRQWVGNFAAAAAKTHGGLAVWTAALERARRGGSKRTLGVLPTPLPLKG